MAFASAAVSNSTLWVLGTDFKSGRDVYLFWSSSPTLEASSWAKKKVLTLPKKYNIENTDLTLAGDGRWTMCIEVSDGMPFYATAFARTSTPGDPPSAGFALLDPTTSYFTSDSIAGDPTIRYFNGYHYLIGSAISKVNPAPAFPTGGGTIKSYKGTIDGFVEPIVRTNDPMLSHNSWETAPKIMWGPSALDHHVIPGSLLDAFGTAADKREAEVQIDDINASDMDMVDLPTHMCPDGVQKCTWVVWLTGNQGQGFAPAPYDALGYQGAGIVNGSQQEWLESFFSAESVEITPSKASTARGTSSSSSTRTAITIDTTGSGLTLRVDPLTQTLQDAAAAVRTQLALDRASNNHRSITVELLPGAHQGPLRLGPEHAGASHETPVVWRSTDPLDPAVMGAPIKVTGE
jgi:hypothetical protein